MWGTVKQYWKSRTVKYNIAGVLLGLVPQVLEYGPAILQQLVPFIPDSYYAMLTAALTIGNIIWRAKTTVPLVAK